MKLILASKSPRRKELLEKAGYRFDVVASEKEEIFEPSLDIDTAIQEVAYQKAKDILDLYPEYCILAADTIVLYRGKRLGKPKDKEQAKEFLKMLSGQEHEVKTGVCILTAQRKIAFTETTIVHFRPLSDFEIHSYVQTESCLDKAGAYGIQECDFSDWIDGSFTNVVGLPMERIREIL